MKLRRIVGLVALPAILSLAAPVLAEEAAAPKDKKEKIGYAIGVDIGTNMKRQTFEYDADQLIRGLRDTLKGQTPAMDDNLVRTTLMDLQKEIQEQRQQHVKQQQEQAMKAAEKNKADGEAFLAENAKKDGVKTLPSGLQYKVLASGTGATPKDSDTVETNYRGTLIDGTEFDSSYKRNKPATFPVKGVIAGWTEALQLMKVGDKWQLFIPSKLGYGDQGAGRDIPGGATLIFEVELLAIK